MTTLEVANRLIELCKEGNFIQAQQELYHADIVSIDPDGSKTVSAENMLAKEQRFLANLEKMGAISYSQPLVAGGFFTVVLKMELDIKNGGHRVLEEVCVYQVEKGKIVFEQFFRDLPPGLKA
jgi:hypothetical protein